MNIIKCPDLSENKFVSIFTNIRNTPFRLTFKWNEYCDCCFLSIFNSDGNDVSTGNALVCKTQIFTDLRVLPRLYFRHKENNSLEPTPETMKDYFLAYEDTTK